MSKLKVCAFRVLIKPDPIETEIGDEVKFVIARTREDERRARAAQTTGTIVQIGPTAWKGFDEGEPWAKVGDRVLYTRYGGRYVPDEDDPDNDLIIVDDESILMVEEND